MNPSRSFLHARFAWLAAAVFLGCMCFTVAVSAAPVNCTQQPCVPVFGWYDAGTLKGRLEIGLPGQPGPSLSCRDERTEVVPE